MNKLTRILSFILSMCLVTGMLPTVASANANYIWLDELPILDSDRYTGNEGDSFIRKIGTRNGTVDTEGNDYAHGLEAWIARWNYTEESSWAWCTYDLNNQYNTLSGTIGTLDKSYNKTNFNTTIELWGDGDLLYSAVLTPDMVNKSVDVDVTGIDELKVSLYDNESAAGGTSFSLGNFRLYGNKVSDAPNGSDEAKSSFQDHYYQVFDGVCNSWQDAKEYCEAMGGHLATITSLAENDFLHSYITSQGYECAYFGLENESRDNRSWTWVTGEPLTFINWADGEPNDSYEPYGMFYFKFTDGKWNDGDFGSRTERGGTAFVCEWDNQGLEPIIAETISDEAVLRAKLLTVDHSLEFYRNWDSPIQIMAEQLDPVPASAWYTVENLIEMYYKAAKDGDVSSNNVGKVSDVEFYEYLLFKLLDSEELDYLSVTEPFGFCQ